MMNLDALKIFCDVVRRHSFCRGAEENRVTQSSASQTIHQIEQRLGVPLIDRSRRPWRLTPEGKVFFDGTLDLLDRFGRLEEEVRRHQSEVNAIVRVAAIYSVGLGPMKQYIQQFMADHPGTRVHIDYLHPDRVYEQVLDGTSDLGIVSFPQSRRELVVVPWREEPMVLTCPPAHRLAGRRSVSIAELRGEPFVGFDRGLVIRRQVDAFLRRHGVEANVTVEFDNVEAIKRAVEVSTGISILPQPTLEREVEMGTLRVMPFAKGRLSRPLGIIHRRGKRLTSSAVQFIDRLMERERRGDRANRTTAAGNARRHPPPRHPTPR
jgi:DNA-binding transcriptional LysR family regulator